MISRYPCPQGRAGHSICRIIVLSMVLVIPSSIIAGSATFAEAAPAPSGEPKGGVQLSLKSAIDRALEASPGLQAARAGVDAAKGTERQARLLSNPEFSLEVENFEGQGPYQDFDSAELTYGVSQNIELGGKRSARRNAAIAEREAAEFSSQSARLNLIQDVTIAYVEAVAAEQSLALAKDLEKIAKNVLDTVIERVKAAREPEIQRSKAEVALATSRVTRQRAATDLDAARKALARYWGETLLSGQLSSREFFTFPTPLALDTYEARLTQTPDIARLGRLRDAREAELRLARAGAVPDPTISLGVRQFRDTDEQALVAGISIPIPVFNQNQGEIARSGAEALRADSERRQAELDQARLLTDAWSRWESASLEAKSLKQSIRPQAQEAFRLTLEGYQAGRFSYLEVLDAQRTLFNIRAEEVDALTRLHIAHTEVERLVAISSHDPIQ